MTFWTILTALGIGFGNHRYWLWNTSTAVIRRCNQSGQLKISNLQKIRFEVFILVPFLSDFLYAVFMFQLLNSLGDEVYAVTF